MPPFIPKKAMTISARPLTGVLLITIVITNICSRTIISSLSAFTLTAPVRVAAAGFHRSSRSSSVSSLKWVCSRHPQRHFVSRVTSSSSTATTKTCSRLQMSSSATTSDTASGMSHHSPYPSLSAFLQECHDKPSSHLVIGNPAGDADSIVSAIALAYVDSLAAAAAAAAAATDETGTVTERKTPVVSIANNDLQTQRPETIMLFKLAGLSKTTIVNHLWFRDDLPALLQQSSKTRAAVAAASTNTISTTTPGCAVTLVDHNRWEYTDAATAANATALVQEIYDHHLDQHDHVDTCKKRIIAFEHDKAAVASTGTLVFERLQEIWSTVQQQLSSSASSPRHYPADLGLLLLGLVLLDSINMNPDAGKVTPRDQAAVQDLLLSTAWSQLQVAVEGSNDTSAAAASKTRDKLFHHNASVPDTNILYQMLQEAKFDPAFWKSLSVRDALRLDHKDFTVTTTTDNDKDDGGGGSTTTFGISTVLLPMDDFLQTTDPESLATSIQEFMNESRVHLLLVMFAFQNDTFASFQRQLMVCGDKNHFPAYNDLIDQLKQQEDALQFTEVQNEINGEFSRAATKDHLVLHFFDQGNAKASRKQVAPILMQYLEKILHKPSSNL